MRSLAALVIVLGVVGLLIGSISMVHAALIPGGVPFNFESYGGPGPLFGSLVLVLGGLYLFWSSRREG